MIGKNAMVWVHPEDREMVRQQFLKMASGEHRDKAKILCRFKTTDDTYLWLRPLGRPLQ